MRIVLLDVEPSLLNILNEALETQAVIIDVVSSTEAALRRLRSQNYDVLVTDLIMEGMNGVDLVQTALKEGLITPSGIVVVTTLAENTILIRAIREHGIHILQKPVTVQQVKAVLR